LKKRLPPIPPRSKRRSRKKANVLGQAELWRDSELYNGMIMARSSAIEIDAGSLSGYQIEATGMRCRVSGMIIAM